MAKHVSMLRGINVGGHKRIKMADLKSLYERLGFTSVVTYIQSGNVIFESSIKSKTALKAQIELAIEEHYGFSVHVELRTNSELKRTITDCPFGQVDLGLDGTKVFVMFLSSKPSGALATEVEAHAVPPERLVVKGKEIYLHCPGGYGKTKLSNSFLERKLGVEATTRNWKSVCKLYELSR